MLTEVVKDTLNDLDKVSKETKAKVISEEIEATLKKAIVEFKGQFK